ncbi:MAG: NAD(P)(+) transhydrogenase (Re/Si-specific) subunit alpha, partial [Steroidobacteraceae bacterium]
MVPEVAGKLAQSGARVLVEQGAGTRAQFPDSAYKNVEWADSSNAVLEQSDVVLTVQPLAIEQIQRLKSGAVVIGFM